MRLLLSSLVLLWLPLLNAGLVEHFCPDVGGKEDAVARKFDGELVNWLQLLCAEKQYPRTLLPTNDGPVPVEIRGATTKTLSYRLLLNTGEFDADGKPVRVVAAEDGLTQLDKWPPKYLVGTFPVETSKDDGQMVRFAIWLRVRNEPWLANRVLTVLHKRAAPEIAVLIEHWLVKACKFKEDAKVVVAGIYDAEFRVVRNELRPEADSKKINDDREAAAGKEWMRIRSAFGERTELLAVVEFDLGMLERDFADTAKHKALEADRKKLATQIADRKTNIESHSKLAETFPDDLRAQAKCWLDASTEDPRNALYRSKAANLLVRHARVEVKSKKLLQCTNEGSLKEAKALLEKLKEEFPANAGILLDYAKCVHHAQDLDGAKKLYQRVLELDPEGEKGKYGRWAAERLQHL